MKAPVIQSLAGKQSNDPFLKKAVEVQQTTEEMKRKTYSIPQQHVDYINQLAIQLGQIEGKPVSSSGALRTIIEQHSKQRGNT